MRKRRCGGTKDESFYIPLVPLEARVPLHSTLASIMKTAENSAHPFTVFAAVFAGQRRVVRKGDTTPLPASRNKRYNTLDLASKIVCQRQASRPSFENLPGTGNRISSREIIMLFAGIHFLPRPTIIQNRFMRQWEKMKKRIDTAQKMCRRQSAFMKNERYFFTYQKRSFFLGNVTELIEDATKKEDRTHKSEAEQHQRRSAFFMHSMIGSSLPLEGWQGACSSIQ